MPPRPRAKKEEVEIPEEYESESDEWKRAFQYAVRKGNYITDEQIEEVKERGETWDENNRYKGAVVYANSHAEEFLHGETPQVKREDDI